MTAFRSLPVCHARAFTVLAKTTSRSYQLRAGGSGAGDSIQSAAPQLFGLSMFTTSLELDNRTAVSLWLLSPFTGASAGLIERTPIRSAILAIKVLSSGTLETTSGFS